MKNSVANGSTEFLISGTFLVLLTLKLAGYIDYSWWIITAPLWGSFTFAILFVALIVYLKS